MTPATLMTPVAFGKTPPPATFVGGSRHRSGKADRKRTLETPVLATQERRGLSATRAPVVATQERRARSATRTPVVATPPRRGLSVMIEEHADEYEERIAVAAEMMSVADTEPSATAAVVAAAADMADRSPPAEPSAPSSSECVVCMDAPASHILAPCGHQCVCEACINVGQECPMCREVVAFKMKVFKT